MSGTIRLSGTLVAGPPCGDGCFPSATTSVELNLACGCTGKPSSVDTGVNKRQLNSASAFTTLTGVGPSDCVQHGDFLYFRSNSDVLVRMTFQASVGPDIVSVIPANGLMIVEIQEGQYLKQLEAQGVGPIEYFLSGLL